MRDMEKYLLEEYIPLRWKKIPLKYVIDANKEVLAENTSGDYEFDYIDIGSVTYGKGIELFQHMSYKEAPSRAKRVVRENDVILSTVRTYLKAVAQIPKHNNPIVVSTGFVTLTAKEEIILSNYLKYAVQMDSFVSEIESRSTGISYPAITATDAVRVKVFLPPVDEQKRIADFLDEKCTEIDSLTADIQKQIDTLEQYKKSVITEAVTKGLNPDVEMKDSGIEWIGEIPKEWETNKIKYLFKNGKGLSITKDNLIETGLPVVSYGQIHSKENTGVDIKKELLRYVDYSYQSLYPQCEVNKFDFIFADTSEDYDGCGNCVYKRDDETLFAGYHSIILHSYNQQDNRYFAYLFKTDCWRKQLREVASGVKLFSIAQKTLINASVLIPSFEEQQRIANCLDEKCSEIDLIISDKKKQLETLEQYKKSLIYEYVTGKKEVM